MKFKVFGVNILSVLSQRIYCEIKIRILYMIFCHFLPMQNMGNLGSNSSKPDRSMALKYPDAYRVWCQDSESIWLYLYVCGKLFIVRSHFEWKDKSFLKIDWFLTSCPIMFRNLYKSFFVEYKNTEACSIYCKKIKSLKPYDADLS